MENTLNYIESQLATDLLELHELLESKIRASEEFHFGQIKYGASKEAQEIQNRMTLNLFDTKKHLRAIIRNLNILPDARTINKES